MVWGWDVILCVNELGDSNSCCFGMRARFCICSVVREWEDETLHRMRNNGNIAGGGIILLLKQTSNISVHCTNNYKKKSRFL